LSHQHIERVACEAGAEIDPERAEPKPPRLPFHRSTAGKLAPTGQRDGGLRLESWRRMNAGRSRECETGEAAHRAAEEDSTPAQQFRLAFAFAIPE
jgi:hypothetical protein